MPVWLIFEVINWVRPTDQYLVWRSENSTVVWFHSTLDKRWWKLTTIMIVTIVMILMRQFLPGPGCQRVRRWQDLNGGDHWGGQHQSTGLVNDEACSPLEKYHVSYKIDNLKPTLGKVKKSLCLSPSSHSSSLKEEARVNMASAGMVAFRSKLVSFWLGSKLIVLIGSVASSPE